jgi:hypothetical protein
MSITNLFTVKTLARLYNKSGEGEPTTSTAGTIGEVYTDSATGLSYVLTSITAGPPKLYNWTADTTNDAIISLMIKRAEDDYLSIRGIDFITDEDGDIVYPEAADIVGGEMVCYLLKLGDYYGRGKASESQGNRQAGYDSKLHGYPRSIVGTIDRYMRAL